MEQTEVVNKEAAVAALRCIMPIVTRPRIKDNRGIDVVMIESRRPFRNVNDTVNLNSGKITGRWRN